MANVGPSGEPIMTPDRAINFQIVYSIKKNQWIGHSGIE